MNRKFLIILLLLSVGLTFGQNHTRSQIFGDLEKNSTAQKKLEQRVRTSANNPATTTFDPLFGYDTFGAGAM